MCWHSNHRPSVIIAEQDIPVKKVLIQINRKLHSPIFSSVWKIGKELKESDSFRITPEYDSSLKEYRVNKGLHSCSEIKLLFEDELHLSIFYIAVNKCMRVIIQHIPFAVVCDFIIPKGASYIVNEEGDYVSNRLKFIKISENYVLDESQPS